MSWRNLGKAYLKAKAFNNAKEALETSILCLETPETYLELGNLYSELKSFEESINCFKKAIELNQAYSDAHFNLGNSYIDMKDNKLAFDSYINVLKIDPNHSGALNCIGILFAKKKKYDKALQYFQKASFLEPSSELFAKNVKLCKKDLGMS